MQPFTPLYYSLIFTRQKAKKGKEKKEEKERGGWDRRGRYSMYAAINEFKNKHYLSASLLRSSKKKGKKKGGKEKEESEKQQIYAGARSRKIHSALEDPLASLSNEKKKGKKKRLKETKE